MQEKWLKWQPINGLEPEYYIKSVSDGIDGFKVILIGAKSDQIVQVLFRKSVEFHSREDERFIENINSDLYPQWSLFKIENSPQLERLIKQSHSIYKSGDLTHFCIVGIDTIVHIINNEEPVVSIIDALHSFSKNINDEEWKKWEPINRLAIGHYDLISITEDDTRFQITLNNIRKERSRLIITFEGSVDAHRHSYTTFRSKKINKLQEQYGKDFPYTWSFFKIVKNSQYIQWLNKESQPPLDSSMPFIHFSFILSESVLDVVASYEPKVEIIE